MVFAELDICLHLEQLCIRANSVEVTCSIPELF